MGDFVDSFKNEASSLLQNKKSLVSILLLGILVLAIPIGMELSKYQRIIKSRATSDPIVFVESDNVFQKDGKWFTKTKNVSVQITSPLGPAGAPDKSSAPTATIQGLVVDDKGKGVKGVKVWVRDEGSATKYRGGPYKSVTTRDDGRYSASVTIGPDGYFVRVPNSDAKEADNVTPSKDGLSNDELFSVKQTLPPNKDIPDNDKDHRSYEAQPFNNVSKGCWNDCNFYVKLINPNPSSSALTGLAYSCSSDNSKVNLSWNTVTGATGYVLRLNRIDGVTPDWNNPVSDINNPADRYISVNSASVNNLKVDAGKDYSWDVQVNGQSNKVFGPNFKCGTIATTHNTTLTLSKESGFVNGETITLDFKATGGTVSVIHTNIWEGITDPSQIGTVKEKYQGFSGSTGQRTAKVPFYVEWLARGSLADEPTQSLLVKP